MSRIGVRDIAIHPQSQLHIFLSVKGDYRSSSLPILQTSLTLQRQGTKPVVAVANSEIQGTKLK